MFDDTIENNLTLNNNRIKKEDYIETCKRIGIDEFISKLPDGYQTQVGENGVKLSGGQRQRIAIARMILQSKDILIFDEPTRGIDVGAKQEIYSLMNKLVEEGKAIIMISSEMSEVMQVSDRILVMHEGSISGELTAEEVTRNNIMQAAFGGVKK